MKQKIEKMAQMNDLEMYELLVNQTDKNKAS